MGSSPLSIYFNPRSREGSDPSSSVTKCTNRYFNPRSREGSDFRGLQPDHVRVISIHAPVKGATTLCRPDFELFLISIHAPVKGATRRSLREHDRVHISIHAPVKGATSPMTGYTRRLHYFNPRSREGSDATHPK